MLDSIIFPSVFNGPPAIPVARHNILGDMAHSDDDLVRRFSSSALRRGDDVLVGSPGRKTLIETSSQEAQLKRILIREYCQQQGLTAESSFGFQRQVIIKAMDHFKLSERTIKHALYDPEEPISTTASSSAAK